MIKKLAAASVLCAAVVMSGGAAYGYSTYVGYNEIMPLASGYAFTAPYEKGSLLNGNIRVTSVGSNYLIDARMSNLGITYAPAATGLNDNTSAVLPRGTYGVGSQPMLAVNTSTWASVTVQTIGTWRSN